MRRTTFVLDEELYRAVKRKAVDRGRPMRVLVEEAIRAYLGLTPKRPISKIPKFGVYRTRIIGSLRRADIYDDYLRHKVS